MPRDACDVALRAAPVKAGFNAHEDGYAGIQQLSHDANLLFYDERGGPARAVRRSRRSAQPDFSQVPEPTVRLWLMAARLRTLPAAIAPVLVGSAAADYAAHSGCATVCGHGRVAGLLPQLLPAGLQLGRVRRGADRLDLHPDRDEPRQRLLRRQARRRHRRPARSGARHLRGLVAPRRVLVRTWLAFGVAVIAGIYLATVAGWVIIAVGVGLDRRRRPLHGRPRPTATPDSARSSSSCSSAWWR